MLTQFCLRSLQVSESSGVAQLKSREDALRAVIHSRERKRVLPFRVSMRSGNAAPAEESESKGERQEAAPSRSSVGPTAAAKVSEPTAPSSKAPSSKGFADWEAEMLGGLAGFAKKQ